MDMVELNCEKKLRGNVTHIDYIEEAPAYF